MWHQLANHLWQSTLFAVLMAALCYMLRRDAARIRYWLWWAASLKFLVPFALLTALGNWLGLRADMGPVPDAWTNTVTVVAAPFSSRGSVWSPGLIVLAVWMFGSAVVLAGWYRRARVLRHVLGRADRGRMPLGDGWGRVDIYRTDERIEPGVVGLLSPALLLPRGIERQLQDRQFAAVLAHELCHIRRGDNLTAAAHMLVESLFWFHPLVWWIGARLIDERERACDEMVVALGHDRQIYAESILDICERYAASPLRCAAGISGSDLNRRITQIMRYQGMQKLRRIKKCILGSTALLAIALPLLAGFALQPQARAQAQDPAPPPAETGLNPPTERIASPPPPVTAEPGQYMPIVKIAPVYPPRAAQRGIEGYVVVEYTVDAAGSTKDIAVIESSSTLFDQAAVDSVQKYKYQPRMIDDVAVEVAGVTTKIVFALEAPGEQGDSGATAAGDN